MKRNSNWRCFSGLGCYTITEFSREGGLKRLLLTELWGEIPDLARSSPQTHWDPSSAYACLRYQFWQQVVVSGSIRVGWLAAASCPEFTRICWLSTGSPGSTQLPPVSLSSQKETTMYRGISSRFLLPLLDVLCPFMNQRKPWTDGARCTLPLRNCLGSSLQRLYFLSFPP